jgi:hypothetical protein
LFDSDHDVESNHTNEIAHDADDDMDTPEVQEPQEDNKPSQSTTFS